jgi:histidinol-phosphate/aromatic aminotransferase/cobyric acid decarboxylase-like protein
MSRRDHRGFGTARPDEAYVRYAGMDQSLAQWAAESTNVVVCTSMSKMYALSGMRVAYLISNAPTAAALRRWTPPWAVSLPAQLAAVAALRDPAYYAARWAETAVLRAELAATLRTVDRTMLVEEATANFLVITLPTDGPARPTWSRHADATTCTCATCHQCLRRSKGEPSG